MAGVVTSGSRDSECAWPMAHLRHVDCDGVTEERQRERLSTYTTEPKGTTMADTRTDRPEDAANRAYYNGGQQWRRVRAVVEADVEWRDDDPMYCLGVASVDLVPDGGVRVRHAQVVSAHLVDDVEKQAAPAVTTDGNWRHDDVPDDAGLTWRDPDGHDPAYDYDTEGLAP